MSTQSPPLTSTANPAVRAARRLAARRGRDLDPGALLVESPEVVRAALPWLRELFITPRAAEDHGELVAAARDQGAHVRSVVDAVLQQLAGTTTPQGLVGVAVLPPPDLRDAVRGAQLVVVLDRVADPGNVGTAVRTADAAGADAVVLTRGSADPRGPKAVRASAGSLFHLPVVGGVEPADLDVLTEAGLALTAVESTGATPLPDAPLDAPTALVFGSEAAGLTPAVRSRCRQSVRIPMATGVRPGYGGHVESLNVSAAVAIACFAASTLKGMWAQLDPVPGG